MSWNARGNALAGSLAESIPLLLKSLLWPLFGSDCILTTSQPRRSKSTWTIWHALERYCCERRSWNQGCKESAHGVCFHPGYFLNVLEGVTAVKATWSRGLNACCGGTQPEVQLASGPQLQHQAL